MRESIPRHAGPFVVSAAIAAAASLAPISSAGVVFDNYANAGSYLDTVNAGSTNVRWYSVYTANAANKATLDITQLRIRLYKPAGYTGGTSVEAFVAVANGADLSTSYPTLLAGSATTPVYSSLGSVSLSSSGGTATTTTVSWGNGASTLASVALNNSWSTHGALFVGFRFTSQPGTTTNQVGIRLSTGSSATGGSATSPATGYIDNVYWKSTTSVTGTVGGPYSFGNSLYSNVAAMDLSGSLTPAPGAISLVGVAGLITIRRRR